MASKNPLRIFCKNCGAPAGYDIVHQTYACPNCGQTTGVSEVKEQLLHWRELHKNELKTQEVPKADYAECQSCGAHVMFKEGEASSTCDFCGGNLVRKEFVESDNLPELIIPFVLKQDEAVAQLRQWVNENSGLKEAGIIKPHVEKLEGYYLPYRVVRGPMVATAAPDKLGYKTYKCGCFIEGLAVNTSKQLDNDMLDAAEPFDWDGVQPFEYVYLGGAPVKFNDLPDAAVNKRVLEEVKDDYRPSVAKALHSNDVEINVRSGNLLNISALMPMYIMKINGLQAAVNGQTGRVAVQSLKREEKASKLWMIEPIAIWLLIVGIATYWSGMLELGGMMGMVFGLVLWAIYDDARNGILIKVQHQGEATRAYRSKGQLIIEKGEGVLNNPFPNEPVFFERIEGEEVPVEYSFTSIYRIFTIAWQGFVCAFLPGIIAALLALVGVGDKGVMELPYEYGAAWYCISFFLVFLYLVRGIRQGIFSHPIITQILPDGTRKRLKDDANRSVGLFAMYKDANGGFTFTEFRKAFGCMFYVIIFILVGCVGAILD